MDDPPEMLIPRNLCIFSDTHACKELHKRSHKFALQNFNEVMNTEEFLLLPFSEVKSSFSEKAIKVWKNLPLVLTLLSKNSCFVKTGGRFFQILWPSHNVLTLIH